METNVGKRIKDLRKSKKMSVDDLAEKIGKSRATVYRYENNEIEDVPYTVLIPIAKALDTTPAYLMGWEEEDDSVKIGRNIKTIRTKRNISLMELAEEIHIDLDTLIQYEKGTRKIPLDILKRFAIYFDTTVDNLMGIELEAERKHVVITSSETLMERYKKWQEEVGYNKYTDEEIDHLIEVAKLMKTMTNDEIEQTIKYMQFLISQRK